MTIMNPRFEAIKTATSRELRAVDFKETNYKISTIFGCNCLNQKKMREVLPFKVFERLEHTLLTGEKIDMNTANAIAEAVKIWCLERGVTHYTHWFQPLTGASAEKHDSFLDIDDKGHAIEKFTGKQLVQGEPDASSFPSGGMRETHEARGYTVWNPSSPMFIMEAENGNTLYIPCLFVGHHGEILDEKTALLRSSKVLSNKVCSLLKLLDRNVKRVQASLGVEQEYFLVDMAYYIQRPDLYMSGRTLIGDAPAKGQQLSDHYFATIPDRSLAFMHELEFECYKLGMPNTTRHNEVAPGQYETAPIFEDIDIGSDHNLLLMHLIKKVAKRHGFASLLHDKPFSGLNGNGKHCNWSIRTVEEESINLLEPGKDPSQNKIFLLTLLSILKGIHQHSGLLRAGISSAGADHRLGANEAPPAIICAFLGDTLNRVLNCMESGEKFIVNKIKELDLGVEEVPNIYQEDTDRNRTSPFAFTGNKFEFRAVGGEAQVAFPLTLLNTVIAFGFEEVTKDLKHHLDSGEGPDQAIEKTIIKFIKETKNIRFEGNNYSPEWLIEAEKRGLPNLKKTPEALKELISPESLSLLKKMKIFNEDECRSRYNVLLEKYNHKLNIEVIALSSIIDSRVVPQAYRTQGAIADSILKAKAVGVATPQEETLKKVTDVLTRLLEVRGKFVKDIKNLQKMENLEQIAHYYAYEASDRMEKLKSLSNKLEAIIPDDLWPLPKYSEMLFLN